MTTSVSRVKAAATSDRGALPDPASGALVVVVVVVVMVAVVVVVVVLVQP